jgi:hypothetical protein
MNSKRVRGVKSMIIGRTKNDKKGESSALTNDIT